MFYNGCNATSGLAGRYFMGEDEIKRKLINLIAKCDDIHWLKTIYVYVKTLIG
jgi:hypothetical protein